MDTSKDAAASWQDSLYDLLRRNNVTQFAGADLGGARGVLLMQSSGTGIASTCCR